MGQISTELARVYRACRRGDMPIEDGTRLASILRIMVEAVRAGETEVRLAELEKRVEQLIERSGSPYLRKVS
jgi:predicted RecB family endonuclease